MKISNSFLRFLFYMGFNILFLFELFLANKIIGLNDETILILYLNQILFFFEWIISKKESFKK